MKLWYVYNKRAILQSSDLCRVVISHRAILTSPKVEFDRIFDQLTNYCGIAVPRKLTDKDISKLTYTNKYIHIDFIYLNHTHLL
jgi:hypothetical protein